MLNFFKLPFGLKSPFLSDDDDNFTTGLLTNYLRSRRDISEEDFDRTMLAAEQEMKNLRLKLGQSGTDNYEIMAEALRRIEGSGH